MNNHKPLQKVLIVDDDPDILVVTKYTLEHESSLIVKCVIQGEEAVQECLLFQPDLILLDVMMPKMDGPTILKMLRERKETAKIPVIFFTAKALSKELESFRKMGAQEVITKPFNPLTLPKEIQEFWDNFEN